LVVWGFAVVAVSGVWSTMPPIVVEWLVLSLAGTAGGALVAAGVAVGGARSIEAVETAIVGPSGAAAGNIASRAKAMALPILVALRPTEARRDAEHDPAT
jgi:hypothetical protein